MTQEETLKSYTGLAASKDYSARVTVRDGNRGAKPLAHHVRHSPTGYNWGYGGSGPGELARCILLDAFGFGECPNFPKDCQCESRWVETAYPAFRDAIIATIKQEEDWKLQQGWIVDWVFDYVSASKEIEKEEVLVPQG